MAIPDSWQNGSNGEDIIKELYRVEHEELFKSVYAWGNAALRTLLLLNGAAALALLAFVGKVAGDGAVHVAAAMVPALWYFVAGAGCAGVLAALGYVAQTAYLAESWADQGRPHMEWIVPLAPIAHTLSVAIFIVGFALFVGGRYRAGDAILTLPPS